MKAEITAAALPPRVKDIRGVRRGLLVAVKYIGTMENRHARWLCQCDCGNAHEVDGATFLRWSCRSCGCYRDKAVGDANRTHGMTKSDEYNIWKGMVARTTVPTHAAWERYGGRGITCCERWLNSFENFFADMGLRPTKRHTLDRVDNEQGYSKENCAWKTYTAQARNRRSNHRLEFNGENLTIAEWTERLGLSDTCIQARIRAGWSIEECVTTPNARPNKKPTRDFNFEWV